MDVPSSVSKSGIKSLLRLWSLACASRLKNWALGSGVCIYTYLGSTPSISAAWDHSVPPGCTGGIPSGGGVSSGVGCLSWSGRDVAMPLRLQRVCAFCTVPCWQGTQPPIWLAQTMARCLSIITFTFLCPVYSTGRCFSSRTLVWDFLIRYHVSSIVVCKNPPMAGFAILNARCRSDGFTCTRPPCLAIAAETLKTYETLVPGSTYEIRLLHLIYTLPSHHRGCLKPVSFTLGDAYHYIRPCKWQHWEHHDVRYRGLWGQMPWWTMEVSHSGPQKIGHVALYIHQLYIILLVDSHLPRYGCTHIQLHAASLAASGFTDHFEMACRVLISVAALAAAQSTNWCMHCGCVRADWCIGRSTHRSARFRSARTLLSCLWSHHLLVWKRRGRW